MANAQDTFWCFPFFRRTNGRRLAVDIQHIRRFGPRASLAAATGVITPTLLSFALYSEVLGAGWKVNGLPACLPACHLTDVACLFALRKSNRALPLPLPLPPPNWVGWFPVQFVTSTTVYFHREGQGLRVKEEDLLLFRGVMCKDGASKCI